MWHRKKTLSKKVFEYVGICIGETRATHLFGETRLWSGMERDGLRHASSP